MDFELDLFHLLVDFAGFSSCSTDGVRRNLADRGAASPEEANEEDFPEDAPKRHIFWRFLVRTVELIRSMRVEIERLALSGR